jgi:hypothetical protein
MPKEAFISDSPRHRHRHWRATIYYVDGEKFTRVYVDRARARRFAARQKKSPVVRSARVQEVRRGHA